jgi:predicted tellurium resistance membrane protein TerC
MFRADRQHLHYQLERLGARRARIVGWIYAVVLTFCALALVVALTRSRSVGLFLLFVEVLVIRRDAHLRPARGGEADGPAQADRDACRVFRP